MMKKSVAELEAEMLAAMELRELKSLVSVTDEVQVVEPAAIRTHWASNHQEGLDEQFEDELNKFVEAHKDLAVKPKDPRGLLEATMRDANTKADALKLMKSTKVHFMGYDKHGSKGEGVYCSCGMFKLHKRGKVLAAWADKHYEKYGHFWKRS